MTYRIWDLGYEVLGCFNTKSEAEKFLKEYIKAHNSKSKYILKMTDFLIEYGKDTNELITNYTDAYYFIVYAKSCYVSNSAVNKDLKKAIVIAKAWNRADGFNEYYADLSQGFPLYNSQKSITLTFKTKERALQFMKLCPMFQIKQ